MMRDNGTPRVCHQPVIGAERDAQFTLRHVLEFADAQIVCKAIFAFKIKSLIELRQLWL
jgi:hypothetical protein